MTEQIYEFNDLRKYRKDGLIKIAVYNKLFHNEYYMTKKELKAALYVCMLSYEDPLLVPNNISCNDILKQ